MLLTIIQTIFLCIGFILVPYSVLFLPKLFIFQRLDYAQLIEQFPTPFITESNLMVSHMSEMSNPKTKNRYPNVLMRIYAINNGLYIQPDFKFEFPRLFQPVLIPWQNLHIEKSEKGEGIGLDKYFVMVEKEPIFCFLIDPSILFQMSTESECFQRNYKLF